MSLQQRLHRFGNRVQDNGRKQAEEHGGDDHDTEAYGEGAGGRQLGLHDRLLHEHRLDDHDVVIGGDGAGGNADNGQNNVTGFDSGAEDDQLADKPGGRRNARQGQKEDDVREGRQGGGAAEAGKVGDPVATEAAMGQQDHHAEGAHGGKEVNEHVEQRPGQSDLACLRSRHHQI